MYCSPECQTKDQCHSLECCVRNAKPNLITSSEFLMTLGSIKAAGGEDELMALVDNAETRNLFDFDWSNPDDPLYEKNLLLVVNGLSKTAGSFMSFGSFMLKYYEPLVDKSRSSAKIKFLKKFIKNQSTIYLTNGYSLKEFNREKVAPGLACQQYDKRVGSGLFLFSSLLNHSCYSNVTRVTVENKLVLVVARPIKAGEQIFISYGFSSWRLPLKERRHFMKPHKFKCDCVACTNDYPQMLQLAKTDPKFIEPCFHLIAHQKAIAQFKKNCNYITKNTKNQPCYEISILIQNNSHLLHGLARDSYDDIGVDM